MPVITISRGTFSGGLELAECIASRLELDCVSREVLAEAAESSGLQLTDLSDAVEKPPSLIDRLSWDRHRYLACVRESLCRHAASGRLVYHGHGGHFLLNGIPGVLRVLVIADIKRRLDSAMERQGLDRDGAVLYIERIDEYRSKWTRFLYGREWRDPFQFDLVVNLARAQVCEACEIIVHALEQESFQITDVSRKAFRDTALSSRAEALLLGDRRTRLKNLVVTADDGVVRVEAVARSRRDLDAVRQVLEGVEGIDDLVLEMAMSLGVDSI